MTSVDFSLEIHAIVPSRPIAINRTEDVLYVMCVKDTWIKVGSFKGNVRHCMYRT